MNFRKPLAAMSWRYYAWLAAGVSAVLLAAYGCQHKPAEKPQAAAPAAEKAPRSVTVVNPQRTTIRREVGQPGVIQAFERTPIVARIPGYVLKWNVDIGDAIHKDELLAELWVPEMLSQLKLKEEQVEQARKALAAAEAQVNSAKALVQEAKASRARAEAMQTFWMSQNNRFSGLVKASVLDEQTRDETLSQYRSAAAAIGETDARIESAQALEQEKESLRDRIAVDILVAEADRQHQADMVAYARLTAPYDGVVTQRNINTKQFVQPAAGDKGDVLYVVERTDTVRIFVSVPEVDADWVQVDTSASVRVQALQGEEFKGKVTRSSWSLNQKTRTLLAEIDLANPELPGTGRRLRPGMYAFAKIAGEWREVLALPASAVVTEGDVNVGYQSFCWLVENGRVQRLPIEIGVRNDQFIAVRRKQVSHAGEEPRWEDFSGAEEIVQGELAGLKDGQTVTLAPPAK